jgi:hypothetical protein
MRPRLVIRLGSAAGCEAGLRPAVKVFVKGLGCALGSGSARKVYRPKAEPWAQPKFSMK